MKIAFASDNSTEINKHFGQAESFLIYEMSPTGYSFAATVDCFNPGASPSGPIEREGLASVKYQQAGDDDDDKIEARIRALLGCTLVYCMQIGGVAAARLVKNKIQPVKVAAGHPINDVLDRLQTRLNDNPPIWLKKALKEVPGRL